MAIGTIHIEWLSRLARKGDLGRDFAVLDLGPQDVHAPRSYMGEVAARHLAPAEAARAIAAIYDSEHVRPTCQADFYRIFGASRYASIDVGDSRATWAHDLNTPVPETVGTWDVITNFGTGEHVFDIAEAFRSMHRLLKPGGLSLHCMPAFAFIDHGFYNVHPVFFTEIAHANAYDIVDFSYVDNMFARNGGHTRGVFDFDKLPIQLADTANLQSFMSKVVDVFGHNLRSTPRAAIADQSCFVFDLLFVALRRTEQSPPALRTPIQGSSLPETRAAARSRRAPSAGGRSLHALLAAASTPHAAIAPRGRNGAELALTAIGSPGEHYVAVSVPDMPPGPRTLALLARPDRTSARLRLQLLDGRTSGTIADFDLAAADGTWQVVGGASTGAADAFAAREADGSIHLEVTAGLRAPGATVIVQLLDAHGANGFSPGGETVLLKNVRLLPA